MTIEKPSTFDYIGMIGYLLISLGLCFYCISTTDIEGYQMAVFMYGCMSAFLLYPFNLESHSKPIVFIFTLVMGICHLIAYWYLRNDPDLQMPKGHAADRLLYTLPFAVLCQLLRIIGYKLQMSDLQMIYRGSNPYASQVDYAAFFIYLGAFYLMVIECI